MTALMVAAHKGTHAVVVALLTAGADVQAKTDQGYTAVMAAREEKHPDVVKVLLAASTSEVDPDFSSWKAFISAGRTYAVPPQWAVTDPFTAHTPHWPSYAQFHTVAVKDGPGTHRLLLRSPVADQSQIFLIHGEASHWQPLLQKKLADMDKTPWVNMQEEQTETADGVPMKLGLRSLGKVL